MSTKRTEKNKGNEVPVNNEKDPDFKAEEEELNKTGPEGLKQATKEEAGDAAGTAKSILSTVAGKIKGAFDAATSEEVADKARNKTEELKGQAQGMYDKAAGSAKNAANQASSSAGSHTDSKVGQQGAGGRLVDEAMQRSGSKPEDLQKRASKDDPWSNASNMDATDSHDHRDRTKTQQGSAGQRAKDASKSAHHYTTDGKGRTVEDEL